MATRLQLRQRIRSETLVESTMMTDADINTIMDEAVLDVATRFDWPWLATTSNIAYVAAQQAYALPANFHKLVAVMEQATSFRLIEVSPQDYWRAYGVVPVTGGSAYFFLWGNSIYVSPVPTASTGGLTLFYYKAATVMASDAAVPEWAAEFHTLVSDFVMAKLWHREEDFSKAQVYDAAYLDGIERMARFYLGRVDDSPMIMGEGSRSRANAAWRMPWFP